MHLAQDRDKWRAVVSTVMILPVVAIRFSRRILLHAVGWLILMCTGYEKRTPKMDSQRLL